MDVTNEVTLLVLDADYDVRLVQPDIAVRIHDGTPDEVLEATSRNVREGINKVKIFNDKVVVNALRRIGVSDADIWNFSFLGCSEPVIDGKTDSWGNSGHINLTKCLELALNDGRCMLTGKQMGVHTEDAAKFSGIEDVKAAYRAQLAYFVRALAEFDNQLDQCQAKYAPLPFYSCVISDCIRGGKEFNSGGAVYNTTSPLGIGPITTGDSLMSIKKIVFEQRLLTMEELLEALKTDFQGKEQVRQMLLNRAPKYGNDIDEADSMSDFAMTAYCDELDKYTNYRNGPFTAGMYYLTANIPHGNNTAATADGRHARTPLNDGGVSPTHGADKRGATAVLRSAGKLSNYRAGHGCVLNQLLHPTVFDSENSLQVFSAYMKSMKDIGTWEAQFNVLTPDDLRDAQKHPEKYRGLVVRVAGYSAYFTALEKEMQDDIIERTVLTTF
jgi:formate C-acetyltransferase